MIPYIALYSFSAIYSIWYNDKTNASTYVEQMRDLLVWLFATLMILFVGLRDNVSDDWLQYKTGFTVIHASRLSDALLIWEPGYVLLNWLLGQAGFGFTALLLACAFVAIVGLTLLARATPNPWIVFAVGASHYVIVMSMGHVRQATAMGFILIGIVALLKGFVRRYLMWCVLATSFHRTAFIFLPLAGLFVQRKALVTVLYAIILSVIIYTLFLSEQLDMLRQRYLERYYEAGGATFRVLLNIPPSMLYLFLRRRIPMHSVGDRLWLGLSLLAIASTILLFVSPSTAAVDRLAKYCIPLQLYVYAWVPVIARDISIRIFVKAGIAIFYGIYLVAWLSLSPQARDYWIPYRSILF
jgi:hypothetical protein